MMPSPTPVWYEQLRERLRRWIAEDPTPRDAAHDLDHMLRVSRLAERLAQAEGADRAACLAAGLLHDAVPKQPGVPAADASAELARAWCEGVSELIDCGELIAGAIATHSYSSARRPASMVGAVLQDADRLDAIGAIGLARVFATAGAMGSGLWHGEDPWASARPLDDKRYALDHLETKLLRLAAGMHTDAGRALAQARHRTLLRFLGALRAELVL